MRRKRRRGRRNPSGGDHVGYWLGIAALLVAGGAYAAWKAMSDRDRAKVLSS
jgi:hypothetical protein